jgi:hypothetical protein
VSRRLVPALLIVALAVFASFVWPTMYRYEKITVNSDTYLVRIQRVTGHADILVPEEGWVPSEERWDQGTDAAPDDSRT